MNSTFPFTKPLAAVLVMLALTGCATGQDAQHRQHHPQATTPQAPGTMSSGSSGEQMGMMDMKSMCDMHQKMMSAKTPEERRAMMDERMKNMSPEMMQQQCK